MICRRLLSLVVVACFASLAAAAEFPTPYDSEPDVGAGAMPAERVAAELQLPSGFKATVFAAEPHVQNPIALAWDAKGRLWVAENYTYAEATIKYERKLRDRIIILADKDGDGKFDERKVFADDLQILTGIEVGLGGVWAICPPQLLFLADKDGDDKPDAPAPEVVLEGFTLPPENYHNFANGLRFGPDGWLYGRCGASAPGDVGRPGVPVAERIPVRGGMWRYSPFTKVFESLNAGTTNPWGHDWDKNGELFFINTVNGHLWHSIPGAHYTRPHTIDPNPHVYELIDFHADHWHFDTKNDWSKSRDGAANSYGGGHAHIGCMIYQGTNWPEKYRDRLYTLNMHGLRANQERLDRDGSGYLAKHEPDLFISNDKWFRGMELTCGPDGGVYVADWSDTGECHERNGVHRTSGRIYKIMYAVEATPSNKHIPLDLTKLSIRQLVAILKSEANEWTARQARLQLAERALHGEDMSEARAMIIEMMAGSSPLEVRSSLRGAWSLASMNLPAAAVSMLLIDRHEPANVWGVRLLVDRLPLDTTLSARPADGNIRLDEALHRNLVELSIDGGSAAVRLAIASALQRLPHDQRIPIARELVKHSEDAADHNIPLMIWYGLIPCAEKHALQLVDVAADCKLPSTRRLIARRLAEDLEKNPEPYNALLTAAIERNDRGLMFDIVDGTVAAVTGWRKAPKPSAWEAFATRADPRDDEEFAGKLRELSVLFGDGRALDTVRKLALDKEADIATRKAALETLIEARPDDLKKICHACLGTRFLNTVAARGLALFDDPKIAEELVENYKKFHHSERAQLLAVLASRPSFAKVFLRAIEDGTLPKTDLNAFLARQIYGFAAADPEVKELLSKTWGEFRDSPAEKKAQIAELKAKLTPGTLVAADKAAGRALFAKTCAQCHKMFGEGQSVGPDLTGANRDNLDYLLENMVDPSAVVSADFRMSVVTLDDGRTFNGLVTAETERTLTFRTATDTVTVERSEIEERKIVPLSLMPENQLQPLTPEQLRDLIGYLQSREQVALPAGQ